MLQSDAFHTACLVYQISRRLVFLILHQIRLSQAINPNDTDSISKHRLLLYIAWNPTSFNCHSLACRACDCVYIDYVRRSRNSSYRLLRRINCQTYVRPTLLFRTSTHMKFRFPVVAELLTLYNIMQLTQPSHKRIPLLNSSVTKHKLCNIRCTTSFKLFLEWPLLLFSLNYINKSALML